MAGDDQNSDNQLFGEHLDPPEPLELSLEPDLGYPPPDPLFKTTVGGRRDIWSRWLSWQLETSLFLTVI